MEESVDTHCFFCDRNQFQERLVGETDDFLIIPTLGQISDGGYTLLAPKQHVSCIGALQEKELRSLHEVGEKVVLALLTEYGVGPEIIFEHGIVGQSVQHAHLHLIPARCNITARILKDFPQNPHTTVHSWNELRTAYAYHRHPYLLWKDHLGSEMNVLWNPPAPSQYLRIVVAEALNCPERANWRTMDPKLDRQLWQETVSRLKPHFAS